MYCSGMQYCDVTVGGSLEHLLCRAKLHNFETHFAARDSYVVRKLRMWFVINLNSAHVAAYRNVLLRKLLHDELYTVHTVHFHSIAHFLNQRNAHILFIVQYNFFFTRFVHLTGRRISHSYSLTLTRNYNIIWKDSTKILIRN
jgi:hypothetical protein